MFDLPKTIQSNQGTNFTYHYIQREMKEQGIKHIVSTAYKEEREEVIERFHETLKSMFKKICVETKHVLGKETTFSFVSIK